MPDVFYHVLNRDDDDDDDDVTKKHCPSNLFSSHSAVFLFSIAYWKTVLRNHIRWLVKNHVCITWWRHRTSMSYWRFTITAEIHAHSLANFYGQYSDRHMNLKFLRRRVSEQEQAIRQFFIIKNKLMSVSNASVLLLIMNFVITLSK